jgi:hypothetical protein
MLNWANEIKQAHWPLQAGLWLARAWMASQAFHSHDIKHTLGLSCDRISRIARLIRGGRLPCLRSYTCGQCLHLARLAWSRWCPWLAAHAPCESRMRRDSPVVDGACTWRRSPMTSDARVWRGSPGASGVRNRRASTVPSVACLQLVMHECRGYTPRIHTRNDEDGLLLYPLVILLGLIPCNLTRTHTL